jgi:hypothetical protein
MCAGHSPQCTTLFAIICAVAAIGSEAKIVDCPPIESAHVTFRSHANYIETVDAEAGKTLWRSTLFPESDVATVDKGLEEDVQWNIACIKEVNASEVVATDRNGRVFRLDRFSGAVLSER